MRHSTMMATAAFATLIATSAFAADLPGKGITVQPIQSTISEESFQTQLVARALEKLGYTVNNKQVVVFLARDITDRKIKEDEIAYLAFYDPLTSLPNRRCCKIVCIWL
mgnify:CR=1 FL=1